MDAEWVAAGISLMGAVGTAGIGLIAALYQRRRFSQFEKLEEGVLALARGARSMLHLSGEGKMTKEQKREIDGAQSLVRVSCDVISLVGNEDVQRAARLVRHHVYALRRQVEGSGDPRRSYDGSPYERVENAITLLLHEARLQSGWKGTVVTRFHLPDLTSEAGGFRQIDTSRLPGEVKRRAPKKSGGR